jgi:hypothetical protein
MAQQDDVNTTAVAFFGVGLAVVAFGIYFGVWMLFGFFTSREAASNTRQYPLAVSEESRLPPEPRLQTNPRGDLRELRDEEDALLNGYRWVDKPAGIVRIPIDQAMRLTIERRLPARPAAKEANK